MVRLACLITLALPLVACGGGHPRRDAPGPAPATVSASTVAGSTQSAAQVAAGAAETPTGAQPVDLRPVGAAALRRPIARYRAYAQRRAVPLAAAVRRLRAAVATGDRGAARRAWGDAFADYVEVGGAYGAFGALDDAIAGTPGGLRGGVHAPGFTGLHRIEWGLWRGQPAATLAGPATRLAADVARLRHRLPRMAIAPVDYATRAHEILEDAQRDLLSGVAVPWSGAGVRGTAAALAATREVIATLAPVLAGRGGVLEPVQSGLGRLGTALAAVRRAHGGRWPALGALRRSERERLRAALGAVLEQLAGVPGALETTPPAPVPTVSP